jgi:hypothetical protein
MIANTNSLDLFSESNLAFTASTQSILGRRDGVVFLRLILRVNK